MGRRKTREEKSKFFGTKQVIKDLNTAGHRESHFDDPGIGVNTLQVLAVKKENQVIASDNTVNDDTELFFPLGVQETWYVTVGLLYTSPATADFLLTYTVPTNGALSLTGVNYQTSTADIGVLQWVTSGTNQTMYGAGVKVYFEASGIVQGGSVGGFFLARWAQATSDVGNTTVHAGSVILGSRIGRAVLL